MSAIPVLSAVAGLGFNSASLLVKNMLRAAEGRKMISFPTIGGGSVLMRVHYDAGDAIRDTFVPGPDSKYFDYGQQATMRRATD